ncbi:MAG: HD domain-containing phosphohydrolase, partial [Candidatus Brocadiales bacterium]
SGYPQGLSDGEIHIVARIVAVADTVEAMSSHRPYRAALGIDKALEEINEKKGVFYDPDAVDACIKLFREKGFKLE